MSVVFDPKCSPLMRITRITQAYAAIKTWNVFQTFILDVDHWCSAHDISLDHELLDARLRERENRHLTPQDDEYDRIPF